MAATMTKTQLVRLLAEVIKVPNRQAAAFLEMLAETAVQQTKKNGVFVLPGLGRMKKVERKARLGRNPQTGETIKIKAKTVAKFYLAKAAKEAIAPAKKKYSSPLMSEVQQRCWPFLRFGSWIGFSGDIAPTQQVPTIRQDAKEPKRILSSMRWSLIPFWAKDAAIGSSMI